jgi:hypothetical protein
MTDTKVRLDSRDLLGAAVIWQTPAVLRIVFIPLVLIWLGSMFVPFFHKNMERDNARKQAYNSLVAQCTSMYLVKYGEPDTNALIFCKKWANTKVRLYENI